MKVDPASMTDVLSVGSLRDSAVVLPSLGHALLWWDRIIKMFKETHGINYVTTTKTTVISHRTHTAVRLWVPFSPDPTMPMDFIHSFVFRCDYLILYGMYRGKLWT
jgi:hypothetical protein